ncbi:hypothetical protein IWQ57_001518 [Coemansia nantahalensis]|uniref:Uncharacterized protein n=1 Tax=Coemansia nantahalensis TaxID=2789366 RepID=A0ACC1K434_9FUNG|nr:hypothetical protein IWQ57_001518 [Coemansia nantahalensis]
MDRSGATSIIGRLEAAGGPFDAPLRYTLAVTALAAANAPQLIAEVTAHCCAELPHADAVRFVEMAREALVKMVSTIGAPRAINGAAALAEATDAAVRTALPTDSRRCGAEYRYEAMRRRGRELWRDVYGSQADRLQAQIGAWSPDLIEVIQTDLYGRLLSDCRVLDAKTTELCAICSLVPLDVPAQLKSHVRGAGLLGAASDEIAAAAAIAEAACAHAAAR